MANDFGILLTHDHCNIVTIDFLFQQSQLFWGVGGGGRQTNSIRVSEWLLRCSYEHLTTSATGRWSCSFLPLLLCSRFLFSYSPFPYFNFLCFYSPSSFLQTLSIRLRFAGHNAWPYAFIEE